jgi:succinate dehydrogenase / fumarate reductase flavoprotein subunit
MRHLGEETIDERLPMIKELAVKLLNLNPAHHPLPVAPAAHYTMGGIHENVQGQVMSDDSSTPVEGLWAAGECGCLSVHGANRLGSNSLSSCVVWGRITGEAAARRAMATGGTPRAEEVRDQLDAAVHRLHALRSGPGKEDPYQLRRELQETMDAYVPVYRQGASLEKARVKLDELQGRYGEIGLTDRSDTYNSELRDALEIGNMIELARVVVAGAAQRHESRGSHAMVEHPTRDDANFLKHTLAYRTAGAPRISYIPVMVTRWQPTERKY